MYTYITHIHTEGLHMIDFEQLKIENQTLIEKIEERSEELAKLKRKKMLTVQILTHIRYVCSDYMSL